MAPASHLVGALVAGGFALSNSASGVNAVLAMFSALIIYSVTAYYLDIGFQGQWTEFEFVQRFRKLYFPPFSVALISALTLGAERFITGAAPELASILAHLEPYAWIGLETSSLVLGALGYVGIRRFGWSGRLVGEDEAYAAEIARIEETLTMRGFPLDPPDDEDQSGNKPSSPRSLDGSGGASAAPAEKPESNVTTITPIVAVGKAADDTRHARGVSSILPVLLVLALTGIAARAQGPTILVDRTGSVADQPGINARLAMAVSEQIPASGSIGLVQFSEDPSNAPRLLVTMAANPHRLYSGPQNILIKEAREKVLKSLLYDLEQTMPAAECTSLPDMLARAASQGDSLLITDGIHTCGSGNSPVSARSQSLTLVVLVRSKGDLAGHDEEIFARRSAQVLRYVPGAKVIAPDQTADIQKMIADGGHRFILRAVNLEAAVKALFETTTKHVTP